MSVMSYKPLVFSDKKMCGKKMMHTKCIYWFALRYGLRCGTMDYLLQANEHLANTSNTMLARIARRPPPSSPIVRLAIAFISTFLCCWSIMAAPQDEPQPASSYLNWKTPTLGGKQLWTDHAWRQGWRIQQNALTGHWRLLDPDNVRHAWGNRAACDEALEQQELARELPAGRVVVLLHGLMRSSTSMHALQQHLHKTLEQPIVCFEYASTRAAISEHAAALREVISGLPSDVRLSFIGHSMGNIVVRHAIGDWQRADDAATLARLDSVVMLGPPNQGASIARQLSKTGVFGWVTGQGGMELGPNWDAFEAKLATPPCPFGIVAGRLPETNFQNPLIDGASDFVVSVEETRLDGATDVLEVPRLHSFLMDDPAVQQAVANFLQHQSFTVQ